jgi:hypothetical protein
MKCPNCEGEMERDEVDNGVCMQPVGPWGCPACHYVEPRDTWEVISWEPMTVPDLYPKKES